MIESGGSGGNSDLYFTADIQDNVSPTADQIEKRLKALGANPYEIKVFLRAYDQASQKLQAAQEKLNKFPKSKLVTIQANTDSIDHAHTKLQKLKDIAKSPITITLKASNDIKDHFDNFKQQIPRMEMELRNAVRSMPLTAGLLGATASAYQVVSGPISTMTGLPFSSLGMGAAGLGAGAAGAAFFQKSFELNAQLEQQMTQLTQVLRTPAAAQAAYGQVTQTSLHTPFNQSDVLSSYIQMAQMGISPKNPAFGIKAAANLGAGAQVPISSATQALQNASLGYFEMFNNQTGRNIRQTDFQYGGRYSGQTYEKAVMSVLKQYQNASETQMQTFKGLMTNIQDTITQKFIIPAGQPVFGAAKGMEQGLANKLGSPMFQAQMAREVEKIQTALIKMFTLVQQGKSYFTNSLEQPLKQITAAAISLGGAFAKGFGGTVATEIKYVSEALTTILTPLAAMGKQVPIMAELFGLTKGLQMIGVHFNPVQDAKGLFTINPLKFLASVRNLMGDASKVSLYFVVKGALDMKNSNDQLQASFKGVKDTGGNALDQLKIKFDLLIARAAELGKSVAQLKTYGAIAAEGVGPGVGVNKLAQTAYYGGIDIAKMSGHLGLGGGEAAQLFQTWEKKLGAYNQIQSGKSPEKVMDNIQNQIEQAASFLSRTLGISLADAAKEAALSLKLFGAQLNQTHMATPMGAAKTASIYGMLNRPGGMSYGDYAAHGSAEQLTRDLLSNAVAPGADVLQRALAHNRLGSSFTFTTKKPNLHGAATADILEILNQYAGEPRSSQKASADMRSLFGPAASKAIGGINLPQFQNPIEGFGINTHASAVKGMDSKRTAQEIVALSQAFDKLNTAIQKNNASITATQDKLSQLGLVTEQAQAALANYNLHTEKIRFAIDQWSLSLQKAQLGLNAVQRSLSDNSQKMADYQQNTLLPIQRAQEDWNQSMLLTSNRLQDVAFNMQKAQFNMDKFNSGMLLGENALTGQIQALTVYNQKLDMLRLQNMGLQADITKTQFHNGFTSTVKPLMGFDLSREIQIGQERQQMTQDKYNTTYGNQHWQLQRAARTRFQAQEMSFAERMTGTTQAASQLSTGTVETMAIQIQQYQEQLHSRKLEEKMYAATVAERPLQDQQYRLSREAYFMQRKISVNSDKIAAANIKIQEGMLPLQHAIDHIQNTSTVTQFQLDKNLYQLQKKQGDLTDVASSLHSLFGDYSKNFDNTIAKGPDSVLGHLRAIAHDMGLSNKALWAIQAGLGQGGPGGSNGQIPKPSGGGAGPVHTALSLLDPRQILMTTYDAVRSAVGGGLLGVAAGGLTAGAIAIAGLNAAGVLGTNAAGAIGAVVAKRGETMAEAADSNIFRKILGKGLAGGGNWLSDLRKGTPLRDVFHPSLFLRQLPERAVGWGVFGGLSSMGHPFLGAAAAPVAREIAGNKLGMFSHETKFVVNEDGLIEKVVGKYKHGIILKAIAAGATKMANASHLIDDVTRNKFDKAVKDFGKNTSLGQKIQRLFEKDTVKIGTEVKRFGGAMSDLAKFVVDPFKASVKDFGKGISGFISAIGSFASHLTSIFTKLHLPGFTDSPVVSHAAEQAATTAAEANRLNADLSKSGALEPMLNKAVKAGAKWVKIGGKVFRIASKAAGVASFIPAAADFIQGNVKQGALSAVNAGSYLVPGLGEMRLAADIAAALGFGASDKSPGFVKTPGPGKVGFSVSPDVKTTQDGLKKQIDLFTQNGKDVIKIQADNQTQVKQIQDQWHSLTLQQQMQYLKDWQSNQKSAQQAALSGPNGIVNYLNQWGSYVSDAYSGMLTSTSDMYTGQQKTTEDGFKGISKITKGWLTGITKQLKAWAKDNGVTLSTGSGNIPDASGPSAQTIQTYSATKSAQLIRSGFAHGGLVEPDHHKIGPGRMVRMVEEGHPEVVIPLAPHRRERALSLLKQTSAYMVVDGEVPGATRPLPHPLGITIPRRSVGTPGQWPAARYGLGTNTSGYHTSPLRNVVANHPIVRMAAGGYVFPFPKGESFQWARVDQGQDLQGPPGGPVLAIAPGIVSKASDRFGGFGPFYPTEQIGSGPLAGRSVYYGHTKIAKTGSVSAGDIIAYTQSKANDWTAAPAGWLELGFLPYGSMAAGAAIAPILRALAKGGNFSAAVGGIGGAGFGNVPPINLHGVPKSLQKHGAAGIIQYKILQHLKKKAQDHYNTMTTNANAGTSMTGLSGNLVQIVNQISKRMHWDSTEVQDWLKVIKLESNGTLTDTNPSSGAYGIAQMLAPGGSPSNLGPNKQKYYQYGGNPNTMAGQLTAMANYIAQRYHDPAGALAFHLRNNYYAGGLPRVPRDNFPAILHQGETVLSAGQTNMGVGETFSKKISEGVTKSSDFLKTLTDLSKTGNSILNSMESIANKQYLLNIAALIKGAGPSVDHLKNLIGADIGGRLKGAPGGHAGSQLNDLIQGLIAQLHNFKLTTTTTDRIANKGKEAIFKLDEKSMGTIEAIQKEISDPSKRKDVINKLEDLKKTFAAHHEKTLEKIDNKIIEELKSGHLKEAEKNLRILHDDMRHKINSESHLVTHTKTQTVSLASLENKLQALRQDKQTPAIKHQEAVLKAEIGKLIKQFTTQEEKKGVSIAAIKYAIAHVRDADNPTGIISDKQLHKIPSALLNKATHSQIGQYTAKADKTREHIDKTITQHTKTAATHWKGSEKAAANKAKASQDHHKEAVKNHATSAKMTEKYRANIEASRETAEKTRSAHLKLAGGHYGVAEKLSGQRYKLQMGHYKVSEGVASDHLKNSIDRTKSAMDHYKNQEGTAGLHLKVATDHAGSAKDHYGKAETGEGKAEKQRDKHLNVFSDKMQKDYNHQNRIENQFGTMLTHLGNISTKIGNLSTTIAHTPVYTPHNR